MSLGTIGTVFGGAVSGSGVPKDPSKKQKTKLSRKEGEDLPLLVLLFLLVSALLPPLLTTWPCMMPQLSIENTMCSTRDGLRGFTAIFLLRAGSTLPIDWSSQMDKTARALSMASDVSRLSGFEAGEPPKDTAKEKAMKRAGEIIKQGPAAVTMELDDK